MNQSGQEISQLSKRVAELEDQLETIKKEQADMAEQLAAIKKYGLSERLHQYLDKTERVQKLSQLIADTAGEDSRSFAGSLQEAEKVQLQETLGDLELDRPVENRLEAEQYNRQLDAQINNIEVSLNARLGDINWDNIFEYQVINDGVVIQKYIAFEEGTITVPPDIKGFPVVEIGKSAFAKCKNTSTIFLPDSIKTIGEEAFHNSGITTMNLPEQLTTIGPMAFDSCPLTEIAIPDGVQDLGSSVFCFCEKLIFARLPRALITIGDWAFSGCESLQKIDFPVGITSIGRCAFEICYSLQKVDLPVGIASIGEGVFKGCGSLQYVRIPDTVSQIGDERRILNNIFGFPAPQNLVIYCNAGSYALQYARKHNIKVDRYENYPEGK